MVKSSLTVLEGDYTLNCETVGGRLMPHSYKQ